MADHISLRGFVCSDIEARTLDSGLAVGSFRMGSTERRMDPVTKQWTDGPTNWYRVRMFRSLVSNAMLSLRKGDRVVVMGKLLVKDYMRPDGTSGRAVEIEAETVGPDLQFGRVSFHRMGKGNSTEQESAANRPDANSIPEGAANSSGATAGAVPTDSFGGGGFGGDGFGSDGEDGEEHDDGDAAARLDDTGEGAGGTSTGGTSAQDGEASPGDVDMTTGELLSTAPPY